MTKNQMKSQKRLKVFKRQMFKACGMTALILAVVR